MSKKISIKGFDEITDPFYRYKMESVCMTEQKGWFIIDNLLAIGKNLSVQSEDPIVKSKLLVEVFKKKFSVPTKINKDLSEVKIKGVSKESIQNAIYEFIQYFVICPQCKNPETSLSRIKGQGQGQITIRCNACSYHGEIKSEARIVKKVYDDFLMIIPVEHLDE